MLTIGKEVSDFVRAYEALDARLARGDTLMPEDRDLSKFTGNELLDKLTPT